MSLRIIQPTADGTSKKDTFLYDGATSTNYGTNAAIQIGRDGASALAHGLIKFDLSGLPTSGITINSVVLRMTTNTTSVSPYTLQAYRILPANSSWTETDATWLKTDGSTNWAGSNGCSTSGTDYSSTLMGSVAVSASSTPYNITLDLTEFASMLAANHGFFLKSSDESSTKTAQYYSADDGTAKRRPCLIVNYTLSGPKVRALVVGGGGGSSKQGSGAGGGGDVIDDANHPVTSQAYTVTIGAGGVGATTVGLTGSNGGDTIFDDLTAIGGGSGATADAVGNTGSSGGGSGIRTSTGGLATGVQGYNGGHASSYTGGALPTGGGGGAGGAGGSAPNSTTGGVGGVGIASDISGSTVYYGAGGGGGNYASGGTRGLGGNGGGGNGGSSSNAATSGTANTGGGAGAPYYETSPRTDGGSGIVIIRYKTDGSDGVSTASTGGTITTSGAYTIHTFTSSGTFTAVTIGADGAGLLPLMGAGI